MTAGDHGTVHHLPLPKNRLAWLRRVSGMTAAQVASAVGIHEATLFRWQSGESQIPEVKRYELAKLFSVSVPLLMGYDDEPPDVAA